MTKLCRRAHRRESRNEQLAEASGIHRFEPLLSPVDVCSFSKGFSQWISKGRLGYPVGRPRCAPKLMRYLPFWAAAMPEEKSDLRT
jgi:hypothetical protein